MMQAVSGRTLLGRPAAAAAWQRLWPQEVERRCCARPPPALLLGHRCPHGVRALADGADGAAASAADNAAARSADGGPSGGVVEVTFRGRTSRTPRGTKLRTALLDGGLTPHNGRAQVINCRGLGTCGTCAVEISGAIDPPSWTAAESLRLNFPPHKPPGNQRLRLACQVTCQGDLTVTKFDKFWGQGDRPLGDVADAEVGSPPFGELEFLLDPARRGKGAAGGGLDGGGK